jgi:multidrug efflux pump subunit AcrA (membrane-fusion protein)
MVKKQISKQLIRVKQRPVLWSAIIGIVVLLGFSQVIFRYLMTPPIQLPLAIDVQTVRVKLVAMPVLIETVGTLTAKDELNLKAVGDGKIQQLVSDAGSYVKTGDLLAKIIPGLEVRAPFNGYLTDWLVKPGEYVRAGTPLIDLVNIESLSLTYKVPESYSSKLKADQVVEVSVKAFPDRLFQGVVKYISPVVDKKTFTILIRATIENAGQDLWPGMSGHVRHLLAEHPNALVIPESSLILTMEGYEVFVVQDGKIEKKSITIGTRRHGRVEVLSGLKAADSVVLVRTSAIAEGAVAVANDWAGDW